MEMQKPNSKNKMTPAELKKFKEIVADPVKWTQIFLTTFDGALKREVPWTARWYQAEMLRDNSLKKVYI